MLNGVRLRFSIAAVRRWRHDGAALARVTTAAITLATALAVALVPSIATAVERTSVSLAFEPTVDTFVNEDSPNRSYATTTALYVDASPLRESYLLFDISGLGGAEPSRVRLRLHQRDEEGSPVGGEVRTVSNTSWTEDITWNTRPEVDGPLVGSFGPVELGQFYEAELEPGLIREGRIALAITSWETDAAVWSSSEGAQPPELIVDIPAPASPSHDGTRLVSNDFTASSDPTYFPNAHRLALTASGRTFVAHGKHANGVQVRWRDPGGSWQTRSRGEVLNGVIEDEAGTGDVPGSIAIGADPNGAEHAWVVWAGAALNGRPLELRRLSDLDHAEGPSVGPSVVLDDTELGSARPDILMAPGADGVARIWVVYTREIREEFNQLVVRSIDDLAAETPRVSEPIVLAEGVTSKRTGTLVGTRAGVAVVASTANDRLSVFVPEGTGWQERPTSVAIDHDEAYPSATRIGANRLIAAVTTGIQPAEVTVARVSSADGAFAVEATWAGYLHPTVASDGTTTWIVMVRARDGALVSRERQEDGTWSATDRIEVAPEAGEFMWPNALRESPRLEFVASRPGSVHGRAAVIERTRSPLALLGEAGPDGTGRDGLKRATRPPRR
jgi:hypothetical protein